MKSLVLFSGGLDSSALALKLQSEGHDVHCLTFDLGEGRNEEVRHAKDIARQFNLRHLIVPIASVAKVLSPHYEMMVGGSYNNCYSGCDRPNILSVQMMHVLAAFYAAGHNITQMYWALHSDDQEAAELPRVMEKVRHFEANCRLHDLPISLRVPFLRLTKAQVADLGRRLGLKLEQTYSCSAGTPLPCGLCHQCEVRASALDVVLT